MKDSESTINESKSYMLGTGPSEDGSDKSLDHGLYKMAKRYHYEVEALGLLSIHVLQANTLIALYDLGQCIYPAAYLTVSACARYGMALKVDESLQIGSDS